MSFILVHLLHRPPSSSPSPGRLGACFVWCPLGAHVCQAHHNQAVQHTPHEWGPAHLASQPGTQAPLLLAIAAPRLLAPSLMCMPGPLGAAAAPMQSDMKDPKAPRYR